MNRKRIPGAVALVCSLILLTGCASGAESHPTPSVVTSTSSTPADATATPSEVPAETVEPAPQPTPFKTWTDNFDEEPLEPILRDFDENNAAVFAKFYINLINYATNTGDTTMLKAYTSNECTFCTDWIDTIDEQTTEGNHFEGFALTFKSQPQITHRKDPRFALKFVVAQPNYALVAQNGELIEKLGARDVEQAIVLEYSDESWQTVGLGKGEYN